MSIYLLRELDLDLVALAAGAAAALPPRAFFLRDTVPSALPNMYTNRK
jgi:hypothetical protein